MFRTNVQNVQEHVDAAVIGGGMAGMATALRLQAAGLSTLVLEAHGHAGGCAGYYRKRGFSFDVGATTLVDFGPGGVGGELLETVGIPPLDAHELPGYRAFLPDREVVLYRDHAAWHHERLRKFGDSADLRRFWALLDRLAHTFWQASRRGVRLPVRGPADALRDLRAVGMPGVWLARHLNRTLGDALRDHSLRGDDALVGLLRMLVEDTVHTGVDDAPLINAALGVTIRGAGLSRHTGGMHGFWRVLVQHYRGLGGSLRVGCRVARVEGGPGAYVVHRTIGLSPRATDWALFAMGLVLLESGHAYRSTHTQHHRIFPHPDDPEGYPAELSLLGAVCYGPVFLVRLWFWSYRRGRDRRRLLAEATALFAALGGGVLLLPHTPALLVHTVMAIVGSWVYPS
jgi:phytoene dehydrogenase-like protein